MTELEAIAVSDFDCPAIYEPILVTIVDNGYTVSQTESTLDEWWRSLKPKEKARAYRLDLLTDPARGARGPVRVWLSRNSWYLLQQVIDHIAAHGLGGPRFDVDIRPMPGTEAYPTFCELRRSVDNANKIWGDDYKDYVDD